MAAPVLVTTRYVPPGSYIGQLIVPQPGAVQGEARLPAYIGVGSRHAVGRNVGVRRSYVYAAALAFPSLAPFKANLPYNATGDQSTARLFKADGTEVRKDNWAFVLNTGSYTQVLINAEVYDQTATYHIDYQSNDRDVKDPIPLDDIREIIAVGTSPDLPEFQEFAHFYITSELTQPVAYATNSIANATATLQAPVADVGNTGTGVITQDSASDYTHNYNRFYTLRCTAAASVSPTRTATFEWSATPTSAGNSNLPPVPLNSAESKPTFSIAEATPATLVQDLELGIRLDLAFGVTHFVVNDIYTFNAFGPARIEPDARHANTNQFAKLDTIQNTLQSGSTGSVSYTATAAYTGAYNAKVKMKVISTSGVSPNRVATFVWALYGDYLGVSGTFIAQEATPASLTQTLTLGVSVTVAFGATHFVATGGGDQFILPLLAPRIFYTAKDDRTYKITIDAKTSPSAGNGHVEASFVANTPEGRFGTFTADANTLAPSNPAFRTGHVTLPDNVNIVMRNMVGGPVASIVAAGNRFTVADTFRFSALNDDQIAWDLIEQTSETVQLANIATDVTGVITGTPNTKYVILNHIPTSVVSVLNTVPAAVSYVAISDSPYLYFPTAPTTALTITYQWRSQEPDPGQLYYFTAKYIRPDELYNTPLLVTTRQQGRDLLAPATTLNHLYVMNEAAFDAGTAGAFYIQVKDADMDGVYTDVDFKEAILASETTARISDVVILGHLTSLADALQSVNKMNDPFARRERLLWVGMPVGTPIGSAETANTIIYTSQKTLQVYGDNPAHGTRILVAATTAKRSIKLEDNSTAEVTVDGSFVAGTLAALTSSFTDPGSTILRKQLPGWSYVETYGDIDSPTNAMLGAANVIYFTDIGSGVYRIEEDVTVDTFAPDFNAINNMTQKQFVTKYIRNQTDTNLVSIVVPSAEAGVGLVKGFLVSALSAVVGRGVVGQFQNADGTERPIDVDADVVVFRDVADPTLYHFLYAYWLKNTIKRLFGLYSVNTNDFGLKR